MKVILQWLMLSAFAGYISVAQAQSNGLKVGDKVPDVLINHIINSSRSSMRLSEQRGKYVILDFYATWCIPCINGLPGLDSLQRIYKNDLVILPVTYQDETVVQQSLKYTPSLSGIKLPFVVRDSIFGKLFPHHTIPHDVIIDRNGYVKAITSIENLTPKTMEALISGRPVRFDSKKDVNVPYGRPLFLDDKGIELLRYEFLIAGYYDGLQSTMAYKLDPVNHHYNAFFAWNAIILNLYRSILFRKPMSPLDLGNNQIELHVRDSSRFFPPKLNAPDRPLWDRQNVYCLNAVVPGSMTDQLPDILKSGIDNFLGLQSSIEKRTVNCYIIRITDSAKCQSRSLKPLIDLNNKLWSFKKYHFTTFVKQLNQYSRVPLLAEGSPKMLIDIQLDPDINNMALLKKQLEANGMSLTEMARTLDFIVLRDKH